MSNYSDQLDQLNDGTLDASTFGHQDHIGVAYEALKRESLFDAMATVANGIAAAASRAGAPDKFNATITLAFMCEIAERMEARNFPDADSFIAANPDLLTGAILKRYSNGRAVTAQARRIAFLPDLALVVERS
ncbi:hypothetical protein [Parasedimentitalea huanghaiensis]|uniref:Uncharacterized protein n=1 Tax=Parasedimentitalea huanghaiensis TaxID=2682100 RepID=A0A6L6WH95_9RHOB|nr:hypothetical protein [Zongyanglinia huanghaiensis]MVO17186.1 hypothetical protein [Zongyanglinia huanghaiensis]